MVHTDMYLSFSLLDGIASEPQDRLVKHVQLIFDLLLNSSLLIALRKMVSLRQSTLFDVIPS